MASARLQGGAQNPAYSPTDSFFSDFLLFHIFSTITFSSCSFVPNYHGTLAPQAVWCWHTKAARASGHICPYASHVLESDIGKRTTCELFYFTDFWCVIRLEPFQDFYTNREDYPTKVPKSQSPRGWDSFMLLLIINELPLFPLFI